VVVGVDAAASGVRGAPTNCLWHRTDGHTRAYRYVLCVVQYRNILIIIVRYFTFGIYSLASSVRITSYELGLGMEVPCPTVLTIRRQPAPKSMHGIQAKPLASLQA
jgi:hypothetical protein